MVAVDYYKKLLGSTSHLFEESKADRVNSLLLNKISEVQAREMEREVTEDEIKSTIFAMKSSKAPGPDGCSAGFFKAAWSVVDVDVIAAIRSFLETTRLLRDMNSTILALVPKKVNPSSMGDFRPITYCNVFYKCITKIMPKIMLPCLEGIISLN